jgi:hypothetical protein
MFTLKDNQKIKFSDIERAGGLVQKELEAVGLYDDEFYLWHVDIIQSPLPSIREEMGYVYDEKVTIFHQAVGFEKGMIYIPSYAPVEKYIPGGTLIDTIRHEYAHSWAALDPQLFKKKWFRQTFGGDYWKSGKSLISELYELFDRYGSEGTEAFSQSSYAKEYVSLYAMSAPKEDFAETFMYFLKYHKNLSRFKSRPVIYKKLLAIKKSIKQINPKACF